MAVKFEPKPGFDWRHVSWGKPDSPPTAICSYCSGALPDVPLILWTADGHCAQFCDECMRKMVEHGMISIRIRNLALLRKFAYGNGSPRGESYDRRRNAHQRMACQIRSGRQQDTWRPREGMAEREAGERRRSGRGLWHVQAYARRHRTGTRLQLPKDPSDRHERDRYQRIQLFRQGGGAR